MRIEENLHRALARKPAPPDFADRVLARMLAESAAADRHGSPAGVPLPDTAGKGRPSGRSLAAGAVTRRLAAAAAAAIVAIGAAEYYTQQRTAAEAERVKQEIALALQITSEKLALVQRRIDASIDDQQGTP